MLRMQDLGAYIHAIPVNEEEIVVISALSGFCTLCSGVLVCCSNVLLKRSVTRKHSFVLDDDILYTAL